MEQQVFVPAGTLVKLTKESIIREASHVREGFSITGNLVKDLSQNSKIFVLETGKTPDKSKNQADWNFETSPIKTATPMGDHWKVETATSIYRLEILSTTPVD